MEGPIKSDKSGGHVPYGHVGRGLAARPGKYGLRAVVNDKKADEAAELIYQEGYELLKKLQADYKIDMRKNRLSAYNTFSSNLTSSQAQDAYALELDRNRRSYEGFVDRVKDAGFIINKNRISYKSIEIADLLLGENAYQEVEQEKEVINKVYTRIDLDTVNDKEYVLINGAFVRRIAYRAVTPPERTDIMDGYGMRPLNYEDKEMPSKGWHFHESGRGKMRDKASEKGKPDPRTDAEFLSDLTALNFEDFPGYDDTLLAYTQVRNGVNKAFSGRSTKKDITSNHGASFSKFGEVTIDLAQVPETDVIHHYNVGYFDRNRIMNVIEDVYRGDIPEFKYNSIGQDVYRANASVIRNREILFKQIPYNSVINFQESPQRSNYCNSYANAYKIAYEEKLLNLMNGCPFYISNNIKPVDKTKHLFNFKVINWQQKLNYPSSAFTADRGQTDGAIKGREDATIHYWAMNEEVKKRVSNAPRRK